MDLVLKRTEASVDGIMGELYDDSHNLLCYTLEHAYDSGNGDGSYAPKIPAGQYNCVRGTHKLLNMTSTFVTFEITNVPNHTHILFHPGNYNKDSDGCVLLGLEKSDTAVLKSRDAFAKFMVLETNIDEFQLTVI
jgi:hypothetical protein